MAKASRSRRDPNKPTKPAQPSSAKSRTGTSQKAAGLTPSPKASDGGAAQAPAASPCDQPLPVGEVVEEFSFGQFVNLVVVDGEVTIPVLVGDDSAASLTIGRDGRFAAGFQPLLRGKLETRGLPARVIISDLDRLIATGKVRLNPGNALLRLSASNIRDLAAGRPTIVTATVRGRAQPVQLVPSSPGPATAPAPAVTDHVVSDLSAFLANPIVAGVNGMPYRVSLTPESVRALRAEGTATIGTGVRRIAIRVGGTTASEQSAIAMAYQDIKGRVGDLKAIRPSSSAGAALQLSVFLPWLQRWTLQGYSRGRLLTSLCLGPGEETTIEVFSWDRTIRTLEQTASTETEQTAEQTQTSRDALEVYNELTKSNEFQWHVGGSLDFVYQGGTASLTAKADAEVASKSNLGSVAKTTQNQLQEGVKKASARVRVQRSTKITESIERGREERVTRKVKNPNLCHTLTLDYYEVRARYQITTTFRDADVHLCVMVPNPIRLPNGFTYPVIREYEAALRPALLDRALLGGFDACRLLRAREFAVALLEEQRIKVAPPPAQSTSGQTPVPPPALGPEETAANDALGRVRDAWVQVVTGGSGSVANYCGAVAQGSQPASVDILAAQLFLFHQLMLKYYGGLSNLLDVFPLPAGAPVSVRSWGPRLKPFVPAPTQQPAINAFDSLEDSKKEDVISDEIWAIGGTWPHASGEYRRYGGYHPEDSGLAALLQEFTTNYQAFLDVQASASGGGGVGGVKKDAEKALADQQAHDDADRLEMAYGLKDAADASEQAEDLQMHLTDHEDYYRYAIFQALPPGEQLERLSEAGLGSGFPPGAVQPRVVGYRGSLLAVPLNVGLLRGASHILEQLVAQVNAGQTHLEDEITMPLSGMSIDTRLGRCTACESFVEQLREAELRDRKARAEQQELEGERFRARLEANPPRLEDPEIEQAPLVIRQEKADSTPAG